MTEQCELSTRYFRMKVPLVIVEDHSDCLYHIQRLLGNRVLFYLVRIDHIGDDRNVLK